MDTPPIAPEIAQPAVRPEPRPAARADLTKRFIAALIDGVLATVVGMVPFVGPIASAAYMLVRDGLDLEFMRQRSVGKQIMKLRAVRNDGLPMDPITSVKRNLPFAIGPAIMFIPILGWVVGPIVSLTVGIVEMVLVLTDPEGRRLGDKFAETHVVEVSE